MSKRINVFTARLFSAAFAAAFLFALLAARPQAAAGASSDNIDFKLDMVMQELRVLREDVAKLRDDLILSSFSGVSALRAEEAMEASEIISDLRTIKSAAMMFYADNMDMGEEEMANVINMSGNKVGSLFRTYLDNPAKYDSPEYSIAVNRVGAENIWLAGCGVSGKSDAVKGALRGRAVSTGLLAENMTPYAGGGIVYMRVR